ncbi:MAG: calcium/sodium antiporter [Candidatus Pacebacteria bacterium]|nr:calcium/sodium antiporter [Candidatus Paceibacterota bacterium]MDD3728710.1 calcium/sodium antiporter [Candidatus Paceibacterota bacterium]MDD4201432.1 calcium/sodium antiporter [Candidatus Paceibacterota bacterium]MDD4897220.1 calcium/sodium antiporter [Candidatus Paceibacterota bacterium]MDD5445726.1 calcium/sodium antiporter [Candidatus Paceibacterota bacterium]
MVFIWTAIFFLSVFVLVKGADFLISSAEKIGLSMGFSPFIIGVTIVGLGTSFPELITSFVAAFKGAQEIIVANAVGSNIVNILLVVGLSAIVGRKLVVTKSLIDIDLPLLAIGTVLFLGIVFDKEITIGESFLMVITYGGYLLYTAFHREEDDDKEEEEFSGILPSRQTRRKEKVSLKNEARPKVSYKDFLILFAGIVSLLLGAKYLIDSLVELSKILNIAPSIIAVTAVSLGTSLPELIVSVKAALKKKAELALGNIFGSNVFNMFIVVGLPGLFFSLTVEDQIYTIGIPTMALATLLFVISGISRKIHMWEGAFYLSLYVLFIAKLFNWF